MPGAGAVEIRQAGKDDVDAIRAIAEKTWRDTYTDILSEDTIERVVKRWYSPENLEEQVESPFFIVADDSDVIGFAHATFMGRSAQLHRIYLDPDHQRSGIGTALYQEIERLLSEKAVERIELEVLAANEKGLEFYTGQGFEERREEDVILEGEETRQKVMVKEL